MQRKSFVWVAVAALLAAAPAFGAEEAGPLPFVPVFLRDWTGGTAKVDSKGISVASSDDAVKLLIGGRLHYDLSAAATDPKLATSPLASDGAIRRAWIEPQLVFANGLAFSFQYDFSATSTPINDALVSYKGAGPLLVAAGNLKEPFSLDQLQSNNTTLFTERSLLDTFAPGRDFGIVAGLHGERWTLAGGTFGGNANSGIAQNGIAGTARLTYAPVLTRDEVFHLAIAGSYRALDRAGTGLSFSDKPEDFLFRTSLVSTGTLKNADAVGRLGLEAAYEWNPFRIQAEFATTSVSGQGAPDRTFRAGYVDASWVINGHARAYRLVPRYASEYAVFQGVDVPEEARVSRGGIGVFEVGARFSAIDLQSGAVRGGAQRDVSLGLNWYPDADIRFMADYVHAHAGPSADSVTGRAVDSDLGVGRIQIAW